MDCDDEAEACGFLLSKAAVTEGQSTFPAGFDRATASTPKPEYFFTHLFNVRKTEESNSLRNLRTTGPKGWGQEGLRNHNLCSGCGQPSLIFLGASVVLSQVLADACCDAV